MPVSHPIKMRVRSVKPLADQVTQYEFESMVGLDLPEWTPGAHIEVKLPSGLVRHYSLCGTPDDPKVYRIAVLREEDGRGGSKELHDTVTTGTAIEVRSPKNNFELQPAPRYLFLAGGIGITPIAAMIQQANREGRPWHLVYGGRSRSSMAYLDELQKRYGDRVDIYADDVEGRPEFRDILSQQPDGTLVYACGPTPMLDLLAALFANNEWPIELRLERFSVAAVDTSGEGFDVELARSGVTIPVAGNETILQAMQARGYNAPFSCENGYCGTCEAVVLDGEPEHRDTYLTEDEKEDSFTMMICVSRCKGERLVIDL